MQQGRLAILDPLENLENNKQFGVQFGRINAAAFKAATTRLNNFQSLNYLLMAAVKLHINNVEGLNTMLIQNTLSARLIHAQTCRYM